MEHLCGRQMFYVPCGTQHLSLFIICTISQNIIRFMESREIIIKFMGDVRAGACGKRGRCGRSIRSDRLEEMGTLKLS